MLLKKTLPLNSVDLKVAGTKGQFSGYASIFGGVDSYGDTILKGAFTETLRDGMPKMFYNHVWDMPIGKWYAKEDAKGLWVEGELTLGISKAKDVAAAMEHGTLDGLSIGGFLKSGDFTETDAGRTIHKWTKLVEISPVVFPADSSARVDLASVKHLDFEALLPECKTERDIERLLRDAGLPKWEAMAIVSRAKAILGGRDAPEDLEAKQLAQLAERLQKLVA
jgi:uncharacterized protein